VERQNLLKLGHREVGAAEGGAQVLDRILADRDVAWMLWRLKRLPSGSFERDFCQDRPA